MKINSNRIKYLYFSIVIVFLDQISKFIITKKFRSDVPYSFVNVIKNFFDIRYVKNYGITWGLFSDYKTLTVRLIITVFSLLALALLTIYFLRTKNLKKLELFALSMIIGGALGNILDRLFRGFVVDFLDFYIKNNHWPVFNIADTFISIGVFFLFLTLLVKDKEENNI